jgi:hypothetical protein
MGYKDSSLLPLSPPVDGGERGAAGSKSSLFDRGGKNQKLLIQVLAAETEATFSVIPFTVCAVLYGV